MHEWEVETSYYSERLEQIAGWCPKISLLTQKLPDIPLNYEPSLPGLVAIQLSMFVTTGVSTTRQSITSLLTLWKAGLFTSISLQVRFTYELWGAMHYARHVIANLHEKGEVEKALIKSDRLRLGARSEVKLPWGGFTEDRSIHIMDLIRGLNNSYPEASKTYEFLCESCHPSYLMQTYWTMAGPTKSNWTNKKFNDHAHSLIDSTISAMEQALKGISEDSVEILELAIKYIQEDMA